MSDSMGALVKCGYCGGLHTYSAEMCRDMMAMRPSPNDVAIRADERRRLREGARGRVVHLLDVETSLEQGKRQELADRILTAILGSDA